MDPIQSITKAVASVAIDKVQELIERDIKSEDAKPQPALKASLRDRIARHDKRLRDEGGSGSKR